MLYTDVNLLTFSEYDYVLTVKKINSYNVHFE